MKRTRAKRKLVKPELYWELVNRQEVGVPIQRLIRDFSLDISKPGLTKLLSYNHLLPASAVVQNSLFPSWLTSEDIVQENTPDWLYAGTFPYGKWVKEDVVCP